MSDHDDDWESHPDIDLDLVWTHLANAIGHEAQAIALTFLTDDGRFGHVIMRGPEGPNDHAVTATSMTAVMSFLADAIAQYWDVRLVREVEEGDA